MPPAHSGKPEPIRPLEPAGAAVPARQPNVEPRHGPGPAPGWRPGPAPLPPALASGPDLMGLLKALRRRWFLALTLGLLCAGGAGAAIYTLLSPRYTAFAQVYLNSKVPIVINNPDKDGGKGEFATYQSTQASRIKSRFVLNAALKSDNVRSLAIVQEQPEPLLWLEEELRVEFKEGAELMTVLMSSTEPDAAVAIVGAVVQAYLQEVNQEEPRRRSQRLAELDDILTKANAKLKQKKDMFKQRADELGTPDAPAIVQKQVNLLATLGEYRSQHARLRGDLMKAEAKLKGHLAGQKMALDPPIPESAVSEAAAADPFCQTHMQRLSRVQDLLDEYIRDARDPEAEPTYRQAKQKRDAIVKALNARTEELRADVTKKIRLKAKSDYDAIHHQLHTEGALVAEHERNAREQVESLTKEAEKIGSSSTELELLRADIRREEKTAEEVGNLAQSLALEVRAPSRVSLAQEAGLQRKDMKRMLMGVAVGPLGAFALVCLAVAFFEFRKRRIRSTEEVSDGLGMRVVGSVPPLDGSRRTAEDAEDHELLESIDGIRTLLLRSANVEKSQVVMVTSAVSGEGKTTLASHLATSLARAGRKTLLVDCDLRRPAAHQLFELPLQPGLSEALLNEVHIAEATLSTTVDGLWVVPAGQWDREVMHAIARGGIEEIFGKLKGEYDFIIVDSHPVLPANDTLLVAQHVDVVLLSLLRDVSQAPRVYAACQRLQSLGVRILGAVVNGMPQHDYGGSYNYAEAARAA